MGFPLKSTISQQRARFRATIRPSQPPPPKPSPPSNSASPNASDSRWLFPHQITSAVDLVASFPPIRRGRLIRTAPHVSAGFKTAPTVWYDANIMAHIVIPDQPGPDACIMDWSRYLSELDKLPQYDEGVQLAIQGARDMIGELEWLKPEGPEKAVSEQIGLSRGVAFRSLRRCVIPSAISTLRPR